MEEKPLDKFLKSIIYLRAVYSFSVTSWYRTEARNKKVGGKPRSQHLYGKAVDVVLDIPQEKESFLRAVSNMNLVGIDEGDHIHIQEGVRKSEATEQKASA